MVGGNLTAENIKTVAEVAEKYGKGYVHMTSRQGIEIPFVNFEDIEEVKAELAKGGVKPGVCGPRVRTVTACQGSEICPSGCIDTYSLAQELDEHYFGRELPHKFKFGVTGCQNNCLKAEENDIGIKGGMEVSWVEDKCIGCGVCEKACRQGAIKCEGNKVTINRDQCNYCGRCVKSCPTDAWEETADIWFPSVDCSEIRSTKGSSFSQSYMTKRHCSVSPMQRSTFSEIMQTRASVSA